MLRHHPVEVWLGFTAVVAVLLFLDLFVLNRRSHVLSLKESAWWTGGLVALAMLFGLFLLKREGHEAMLEYYAGYLLELSLSVDNLFVFLLLFQYFAVPPALRPKVLKWGIFGALVMRAAMILAGAVLLQRFEWIIYLFGAILVYTGLKMFRPAEEEVHPERNPLLGLLRRVIPVTDGYEGDRFFVRTARGALQATPLLVVLVMVEWTDLVFAIDSIPAVYGVTRDPFIVYSSNVFAILGLRALFFLLAGIMDSFRYLKPGVALILIFVGLKMVASRWVHLPVALSLGVIAGTLLGAILLSLWKRPAEQPTT
ncbi:MAG TPA: TerC family protein [Gemmatimonadales bacterium]|jgi:tellurite resistance protein TerC|nr:TerC family protein [Gemmatimonadales bacterium]